MDTANCADRLDLISGLCAELLAQDVVKLSQAKPTVSGAENVVSPGFTFYNERFNILGVMLSYWPF